MQEACQRKEKRDPPETPRYLAARQKDKAKQVPCSGSWYKFVPNLPKSTRYSTLQGLVSSMPMALFQTCSEQRQRKKEKGSCPKSPYS